MTIEVEYYELQRLTYKSKLPDGSFQRVKLDTSGKYRCQQVEVPDSWNLETDEHLKTLVAAKLGDVSKIKSIKKLEIA